MSNQIHLQYGLETIIRKKVGLGWLGFPVAALVDCFHQW